MAARSRIGAPSTRTCCDQAREHQQGNDVGFLARLKEALRAAPAGDGGARIVEAAGQTVDADDAMWNPLTGDASRNLTPLSQQRMQDTAVYLWDANLIANRIVELPLVYVLGEGVKLVAGDKDLQGVLDAFWSHPINAMNYMLPKKVRELSLFGEQAWPAYVNSFSGAVQLGYIDPGRIMEVVVDPDNPSQAIGLVVGTGRIGEERRYRVIINGPEVLFTQRTQQLRESFIDGDCFYFTVNTLTTTRRGRSDLRAPADWLDAYDQFLFGEMERSNFLRAFVWDVTISGADEAAIKERAKQIKAPSPGSVRVHNESEVWKAETPGLQAGDSSEAARLFRNHSLGGATIPEHWFGGGGDVNRAVGAEMGAPTYKVFSMRQREVGYMLETVGRFAIRQHLIVTGDGEPDWNDPRLVVKAVFPEMVPSDTTKYASALGQVAGACVTAMDGGMIGKEAAVNLLGTVAGRLGYELDPQKEIEAAQQRKLERAAEDRFPAPDLSGSE